MWGSYHCSKHIPGIAWKLIIKEQLVTFRWENNNAHCVLHQQPQFDCYRARSLKQQFAHRNAAPFGQYIPIPGQTVFALTPWWCSLHSKYQSYSHWRFGQWYSTFEVSMLAITPPMRLDNTTETHFNLIWYHQCHRILTMNKKTNGNKYIVGHRQWIHIFNLTSATSREGTAYPSGAP